MNNPEISTIIRKQIAIRNYLYNTKHEEVISEITEGLSAQQKYIPSKFFYDVNGSKLFEDITSLPEYYPTRTEKALLKEVASQISKTLRNIDIVELGSGDCSKISILLDAIPYENMATVRYIPVDVSHAAISKSAEMLVKRFPDITIIGLLADFLKHLSAIPKNTNRLFCFFGSTLGNLTRKQSVQFLMDLKAVMKPGDQLLIGLDMVKDVKILESAYNDKQGVTAEFNKNILNVVNGYAKTDFSSDCFEHVAYYNQPKARIEMHLRALKDLDVICMYLPDHIRIKKGETIHTENSHKYTYWHIYNFASITGLKINAVYTDNNQWFSLGHFIA
jgi:L-histidine N-alpha-methyltransferase